jgi:hypothetical protein
MSDLGEEFKVEDKSEFFNILKMAWADVAAFSEKHKNIAYEVVQIDANPIIEPTEWTWKQELVTNLDMDDAGPLLMTQEDIIKACEVEDGNPR